MREDFPHPTCPTTATSSPGLTLRLMLFIQKINVNKANANLKII